MPSVLTVKAVTKIYPGVVALAGVDLTVDAGEVRALLGKNGAGKSTLIKILSGAVQLDSGEIQIDGKPVDINQPRDAFEQGIATVYQEMSLVPGLTVAENILLGRWPQKRRWGVPTVDQVAIRRTAQAMLDLLEVKINLDEHVLRLSMAEQQLVEIAKAIAFNPRVMILDEPTSALPSDEVDILHRVVRRLAATGMAVIYVTHRLQEIPHVADSVTVLRDGREAGTIPVARATPRQIAQMMIGTDWQRRQYRQENPVGEVKLAVQGLTREGVLHDISFEVRSGEVLGIAGLMGSGRTELLRAIFGLDPIDGGEITVGGQTLLHPTPARMKALGVGLTPEDRKRQGLILPFTVRHNLTLASLNRIGFRGILQARLERSLAEAMVSDLDVRTANLDVAVKTLSGGNQQKVVVGNWLNIQPAVLFMDEPTRGIDIHAKEQMFALVRDLAQRDFAVIVVSSELEEVLDLADRILILRRGRLSGEVWPAEIELHDLFAAVLTEDMDHGL